jgi:hypothetical protein
MVQAFPPNRPYQPLDVSILPGRLRCSQNFLNTKPICGFTKSLAVAPISIPQQVTRSTVSWEGFAQLVSYPFGRGIFRDRNVDGPTAIMRQNHEDKQHPKEDCWNHEEVRRNQILRMVCEKRAPGLGWWLAMTHHVFSNCGF